MDPEMIIEALKEALQNLENIKTEINEQQEDIRKTIQLIRTMIDLSEIEVEERDCEHCKNHDGMGCQVWDCKFDSKEEVRECDGCHREYPKDDLIETEYGYLCPDCFRDRMEIEDRNINE